jgi:hypothetical protein
VLQQKKGLEQASEQNLDNLTDINLSRDFKKPTYCHISNAIKEDIEYEKLN